MLTYALVAALVLALIGLPAGLAAQEQKPRGPEAAAVVAGPQRIEMIVHGLSCPFCAYGLEKKLRTLDGVDSLSIDFKTGKVVLLVRDGSKAGDRRLQELVEDAGFEVAGIDRAPRKRERFESGADRG